MLPTYEATLQPDGRLQFTDREVGQIQTPQRVLVIFTEQAAPAVVALVDVTDWRSLAGVLADSPHWNGDPQLIQQALRDEWH